MFLKRLINWVASWGGPLGTATGQQTGLPVGPVIDQTQNVPADKALQISTVWACVSIIANTLSTLPLNACREDDEGGLTLARDSRLWHLLRRSPNAWMTPSAFIMTMVLNRMLRGNAYARIDRDSAGEPIALVPLSSDQMEVIFSDGRLTYRYFQDGEYALYRAEDVIHWKGIGNGWIGLSALEFMQTTTNEAIKTQNNANLMYGKGSKPSGVLRTDEALSAEQFAALKSRFQNSMTSDTAGLLVVDRGLQYQQISLSPADAQLLETRKFTVEEICRWFGVPAVLVQADGATTWGSGIAQIVQGFYKFAILPLTTSFEQALEKGLVPVTDSEMRLKFDTRELLRADPATLASYYATNVQNGLMSRNEARRQEGLPPVEGGDALTAQTNLTPIEKLGQTATQPASTAATPAETTQPPTKQ
ncbi:phage portal protein [Sutterella sp.]|uniref:phage portal protein n=1 Tax=Sutterella sp. TaxID=1981025 RepID=UPI0026DEE467|nr:phage portal protein [Sutterella sp.]MDO5531416.1 phage portal protein [Sutterella sp.]